MVATSPPRAMPARKIAATRPMARPSSSSLAIGATQPMASGGSGTPATPGSTAIVNSATSAARNWLGAGVIDHSGSASISPAKRAPTMTTTGQRSGARASVSGFTTSAGERGKAAENVHQVLEHLAEHPREEQQQHDGDSQR